jgi:AcrR family transcriptional regulator
MTSTAQSVTTDKVPAPRQRPGLRERNKADKLRRIQRAARELFVEKGYDNTTTREIAERADVGLGTIFAYAADKRDLLFLIFNSEIETVFKEGQRQAQQEPTLLRQLVAHFRSYYAFYAQQPALSRFMLRELMFYQTGKEARRYQDGRKRLLRSLEELVARAQAEGHLGRAEAPGVIAQAVFAIYAWEVRRCVSVDDPDVEAGLVRLHRMLALLVDGVDAPSAAPRDNGR